MQLNQPRPSLLYYACHKSSSRPVFVVSVTVYIFLGKVIALGIPSTHYYESNEHGSQSIICLPFQSGSIHTRVHKQIATSNKKNNVRRALSTV